MKLIFRKTRDMNNPMLTCVFDPNEIYLTCVTTHVLYRPMKKGKETNAGDYTSV